VCAVAEGEWRGPGAVYLELVGSVEDGRVTVGGGKYDEGRFACADGDVTEDLVVCGGTRQGLRGAVEAEQLGDQSIVDGADGLDGPDAITL
jgi:hypothetical protein